MVAAAGRPGQGWLLAARQAGAPAGLPSVVGELRLQPTRLRVLVCRPSSLHPQDQWASSTHAYGHQPRRPSTCSINASALSHQAVRSRLSSSGSSS